MTAGHRPCRVALLERGLVDNRYGEITSETTTVWGERWASFIPDRGSEDDMDGERKAIVSGRFIFNYFDLCIAGEGGAPKLLDEQRLGAMIISYEGLTFDIVGIAPDLMTRETVTLRAESKRTGA